MEGLTDASKCEGSSGSSEWIPGIGGITPRRNHVGMRSGQFNLSMANELEKIDSLVKSMIKDHVCEQRPEDAHVPLA